jgi:hypothetical protein
VEKDARNEKASRSKLEEEYSQMQQNHEDEVSLRLKFEAKLKDMHT